VRLTAIKLAGFKSFVDPMVIPIPAQLTGVVGPNGCGKSNVIDAVRWVLGESQAKHLRGETMQDVIFNGSGSRKPVSRASVELIFDNSQGRLSGPWSQYGEIAVKRVLTRNGESSYHINNIHVRRRDVADLFLGTGLGARAYAIIEQGMISRIIEAKPEELRAFLEEAAGISRYKERRRETETRLKDARDNLLRVEDIQRELGAQIERLEVQAEVAQRYRALQTALAATQQRLWFARYREAAAVRERAARQSGEQQNRLDAETARLREIEAGLEGLRAEHFAAQDGLNQAQGAYYAAKAEVTQSEQALQHLRASRERLISQQEDLRQRTETLTRRGDEAGAELVSWRQRQAEGAEALARDEAAFAEAGSRMPRLEQAQRDTQKEVGDAQRELSQLEQARQVDETHLAHARRQLEQWTGRAARLAQEKTQLPRPDLAALASRHAEMETLDARLSGIRDEDARLLRELEELEARQREDTQAWNDARQELDQVNGELGALQRMQESLSADDKLRAWLEQHGLSDARRLWQELDVEPGWEAALEALLQDRLQALAGPASADSAPPARLTLIDTHAPGRPEPAGLAARAHARSDWAAQALGDWLHGVETAADLGQAIAARAALHPGQCRVTPEGHVVRTSGVTFHGPHTQVEAVLARQRDIRELGLRRDRLIAAVAEADARRLESGQAWQQARQTQAAQRQQNAQIAQRHQALQLEIVRLEQHQERIRQRESQIDAELAEISPHATAEQARVQEAELRLEGHRGNLEQTRRKLNEARDARDIAERELSRARETLRTAERTLQETRFNLNTCESKINDLTRRLEQQQEDEARLIQRRAAIETELASLDEAPIDAALQARLQVASEQEQKLAETRNAVEAVAERFRAQDEARLQCEHGLDPLRAQLEALKLKEQEARLSEEQFLGRLTEAGGSVEALANEPSARAGTLERDLAQLQQDIEALGAVNLAALEELGQTRERADYLASQFKDLTEAVETLMEAIRQIDQETRERLMATFDQVNTHLAELFPKLFGGGQAELRLTGEELLDAGVQVFAQPPGKKNTSIHLLSGGEKALTAVSLVFSMFRLNPAPFCLLDEVDAPLDDANTDRFCQMVKHMSEQTQFVFITHNRVTMEMSQHLIGVTMQEQGVSRVVAVDVEEAVSMRAEAA
jgi:chromosome segregation protein